MLKKISKKIITKIFLRLFKISKSNLLFDYDKLATYLYIISKKINQLFTRKILPFINLSIDDTKLKKYKIALVKDEALYILYNIPSINNFKKMILTSNKHTGMVGLFTNFNADFFIVNKLSHNITNINWSEYDIVISFDVAIPANITSQYSKVVWGYMITEPLTPEYQYSINQPINGYDLFLNQFSTSINLFKQAKHIVNFPFSLQHSTCFHELTNTKQENNTRSGVFIEPFTYKSFTNFQINVLAKSGKIRTVSQNTETIVMDLLKSKYFIRLGGTRKIWGNALVEAVAAGCLAIGNPREIHNNLLLTKQTSVSSFTNLIKLINYFEENPLAYKKALLKQQAILNYFFYFKPLLDLQNKVEKIKQQKSIKY